MRSIINTHDLDMAYFLMCENNPGASAILTHIFESDAIDASAFVEALDDMNIRGSQIWAAFSDHCGRDVDAFIAAVNARDAAMVDYVNHEAEMAGHGHIAVVSGARSEREATYATFAHA